MKFFLDENLPLSSFKTLQDLGHTAEHANMAGLRGRFDSEIAIYARRKSAILIAKDLEFGNLMLYPAGSHFGLLVLRVPYQYRTAQIYHLLGQFLGTVDLKSLPGAITVLEVGRYRRRSLE